MNANTADPNEVAVSESPRLEIDRSDTGVRVLLTLLFAVIWGVMESLLAVIVIFSLIWSLITREAPPLRLRELSNRMVSYAYRIWRYITLNEARVPFPFTDFPDALEDPSELGSDRPSELHSLLPDRDEDFDEDEDEDWDEPR
jgi:hypothetical protein